jgi:hypothetical protein
MGVNMRIRRTILAPAILAIGATGAFLAGPIIAVTTAAAPTASRASASPNMSVMHGPVTSPNMNIMHGAIAVPDLSIMHG